MMKTLGEQMRKNNMNFAQHWISRDETFRHEEMVREIGNKHSGKWWKLTVGGGDNILSSVMVK